MHIDGFFKQWRYFGSGETGNATSDACHEEVQLGMIFSKFNEFIDVRLDSLHAALHSRNGIRLPLNAVAVTHHSAEFHTSGKGGATCMVTLKIAAKNENLVRLERNNVVRSDSVVSHMLQRKLSVLRSELFLGVSLNDINHIIAKFLAFADDIHILNAGLVVVKMLVDIGEIRLLEL